MGRFIPRSLFAQALLLFLLALSVRLVYLFGMGKIGDSSHVEVEQAAITWAKEGRLANAFGWRMLYPILTESMAEHSFQ